MILDLIQQEVYIWGKIGHPAPMQRFVIELGTEMYPANILPSHIKSGVIKECFYNAYNLALDGYTYVEGYAVNQVIAIPIHHAWVIDRHGAVIDNTWSDTSNCAYFGIEFDIDELLSITTKTGVYGLLDTGIGINMDLIYSKAPHLENIIRNITSPQLDHIK